jgi:hypothetical protein
MKITLVITNSRRKNIAFASNDLGVLPLNEAVDLAKRGEIDGAYAVNGRTGEYIRTKPSIPKGEEFESVSISGSALFSYVEGNHAVSTPALSRYISLYLESLKESNDPFITPVEQPKVLVALVKEKFQQNKSLIFSAAKKFNIDQNILGAILIDEIARFGPFEKITDLVKAEVVGLNASAGVAQVKIDTANDLIKKGIYNPNPDDLKLPFKKMNNANRVHLYKYLVQPKHSIFFAAAFIRYVLDFWSPYIDLSKRPEIIGTLYSQGYGKPKVNPQSIDRGDQIGGEFYGLAKKWLGEN